MSNQGRVVWHDLMSTDAAASEEFFTKLFGWEAKELDMGTAGKYRMLSSDGTDVGGIVPFDKSHGAPSHWIAYVAVDSVDDCCERVTSNGGKVCVPATDIPNIGRFAVIEDSSGAIISPFTTASEY
ncbi:MAG: VOC family protein, partial [Planctomycetota bacterium]